MALKFIIPDEKGKSWKIEKEADSFIGKSLGDKVEGNELSADLNGYELEITGGSDISGFPLSKEVEGIGLRKLLLKKGFGMKDSTKGIRRRKTFRGKTLSEKTIQVNMKILKHGKKKLAEIFPDQNKVAEVPKESAPQEVVAT